jgi:hypothetical protein
MVSSVPLKRRLSLIFCLFAWTLFLNISLAVADTGSISGLRVDTAHIPIQIENEGYPNQRMIGTLNGTFHRANATLKDFEGHVLLPATGKAYKRPFQVKFVLSSKKTSVLFTEIDAEGKVETQNVIVLCPEFEGRAMASGEIPSFGSHFGVALGVTHISYSQTGITAFDESLVSFKASYQHPLSRSWDFGINTYVDFLPLSMSSYNVYGRFFGLNARVGYALPIHSHRWAISVAGGAYYTTMFTSGQNFGFRNLFGPQLFPIIRYSLSFRDSLSVYYKFSPITSGTSFSFSSHEQAAGLILTRTLPKRKTVSVTLDFIQDEVNIQGNAVQSQSNCANLGFGYGF